MGQWKGPGVTTDGLNANTEAGDFGGVVPIPSQAVVLGAGGGQLYRGQVLNRDVTKQCSSLLPSNLPPSALFAQAGDSLCLPTSANAGDVYGVYQGATLTNSAGASVNTNVSQVRKHGVGIVLAGTISGGTSVKVGDALVASTTAPVMPFALSGTRAIGTAVGRVIAYPINVTATAAIAAGSATVSVAVPPGSPANMYPLAGITTSTALTFDTGSNQEIVTPSSITAGVVASTTLTFATTSTGAGTATVTFAGTGMPAYAVTIAVSATATVTASANAMTLAINNLQGHVFASNSAGVVTVSAATTGTAGNSITATPSITATSQTFTGTAALSGGTASSLTATFVNAHPTGCPIVGLASALGSVIIPVAASGPLQAQVFAEINTFA